MRSVTSIKVIPTAFFYPSVTRTEAYEAFKTGDGVLQKPMNNSVNTTLKFGRPWWQSYHVDMQQDGAVVKTYIPAAGIDSRENLGQSQALGAVVFLDRPWELSLYGTAQNMQSSFS